MSEAQALLAEIERFIGKAKMGEATFGRLAVNDGKLVSRLRAGSSITLDTAAKIRGFISQKKAAA